MKFKKGINYISKLLRAPQKLIATIAFLMVGLLVTLNSYAHEGGSDILINAGGPSFTDSQGRNWASDSFYNTGSSFANSNPISGTIDDTLYQSERWDPGSAPELNYAIPVDNGNYKVVLHFAEIYSGAHAIGKRVFDVSIEGTQVENDLDIYKEVGGNTAMVRSYDTTVGDGYINIDFGHVVENPKISGIEVHHIEPVPTTPPDLFAARINAGGGNYTDTLGKVWSADNSYNTGFGFSGSNAISGTIDDTLYQSERWDPASAPELIYNIPAPNGQYDIILHFAEIYSGAQSPGSRVFDVFIEGSLVEDNLDIFSQVGANTALIKTYTANISDGSATISFGHVTENPKISAIEVLQKEEQTSHLAHAVAGEDQQVVDLDGNGSQSVTLDGSFSHTHAFNESIVKWDWKKGGNIIASGKTVNVILPIGVHQITLYVEDSAGNNATDDVEVEVLVDANVPGLISYYYKFNSPLSTLPTMNDTDIDWGEVSGNINFNSTTGTFAGTPYNDHFAAKFLGYINIPSNGTYGFALESDDGSRLLIDGTSVIENNGIHGMTKVTASKSLTAGKHPIEIQFFDNEGGAGLKLYWTQPGQTEAIVPGAILSHNYSARLPIINTISPSSGSPTGGNKVTLSGFGFVYPASQTTVNFGGTNLTGSSVTIVDEKTIEVNAPSHSEGTITLNITTPKGTGNSVNYLYSDTALPPVQFTLGTLLSGIEGPTTLAFGPDGKLYVGTQYGNLVRITLDENENVVSSFTSSIIQTSETSFRSILGIAFNPLDDPSNPKVYVSHSHLFHGQSTLANSYKGKVSVVSGPNLDVKTDLITNLPVSDHDHGINGIEFGLNGDMYVQVGGNTNAGVPGALSSSGVLPEAYFTAATLVAKINTPGFNGNLTYNSNGIPNSTSSVDVFASGQRNPYDILLHSNGKLYGTDNGPNFTYGGKSITCSTAGPDPQEGDELNLIVQGKYYGHANRLRGATDSRQCVWRSMFEASDANYTAPLTTFPASTNGLAEYWTNNFVGQMKGHMLASRYLGEIFDITLSGDGTTVTQNKTLSPSGGLDVAVSPKGTIFLAKIQSNQIIFHKPNEPTPTGLFVNSVFPYRGPATGGRVVAIRGNGFGNTSNTTVTIGGNPCAVSSVTSNKIICTTPTSSQLGAVDAVVSVSGVSKTLSKAYIYSGATGTVQTGTWSNLATLPSSLGEISAASVNGEVYIFHGEDGGHVTNNKLYKYNAGNNTWTQLANQNVVPTTDHAAAGVINGKIYVFGGIGSSGESNSLAIYDPATNSWSAGAPLTKGGVGYGIGSPAGGVVNGKLYIAGGIHANTTINNTFVYDPATNSWSELAPMPAGRNHAAGVGYNGKFYVFGGRCCGGNTTGLGNNNTYIYNPANNSWSTGANLPTARGGMGSAVELNGELLVIGGEGSGPSSGTFPNVEAYNPTTNSWRALPNLPTPRHGIFPVNANGKIHVVAGGTSEGFSVSNIHQVYTPSGTPSPTPTPTSSPSPTPTVSVTPTGSITPTPTGSPTPTPTPGGSAIRVNAGGNGFTDSFGNLWTSDTGFNTGNAYSTSSSISNTSDQQLYNSERWDASASPELVYSFNLSNGNYKVILHFAEIYSGAQASGKRIFDVSLENTMVLDNYDIFADVGGYKAVKIEFNVNLTDGTLNILFGHVTENPKVSGIEIIPL